VLSESKQSLAKFGQAIWDGLYVIVIVNDNGTVHQQIWIVSEAVNIKNLTL
jgi:hypothetical protein